MLLSRSKMTNRIVALHSRSKRNDAVEKNGTLLCFAGCVGSSITSELLTKHLGSKCYPALLLRINESPLMLLQWCLLTFSSLWTGVLKPIRIWILTCWWFLTIGILPGSWWHELGRGGWCLVVSGSLRKCFFYASVILPILQSWTSFLNIVALPCFVSRTFSIQSGLLAPVYSFVIDNIQGIFLWRSFLLMLGASMTLFFQMKQQVLVRRTCRKEMVVGQSTLVHLRHSDRV
ncbi:cytochrom C asm domain-containing protein [Citrus sinensis]|uniref:Cytochrom C asm domain-containing protein n=1 Tax=Citrus sinensis TaxID=2711 RepID=A0ACB8KQX5_CITSI|nr:cytochrom C asm domain-containing protein [Citrus sinensis]